MIQTADEARTYVAEIFNARRQRIFEVLGLTGHKVALVPIPSSKTTRDTIASGWNANSAGLALTKNHWQPPVPEVCQISSESALRMGARGRSTSGLRRAEPGPRRREALAGTVDGAVDACCIVGPLSQSKRQRREVPKR
jgi:hypothetical protein